MSFNQIENPYVCIYLNVILCNENIKSKTYPSTDYFALILLDIVYSKAANIPLRCFLVNIPLNNCEFLIITSPD